jgi:hypothetical protein
MTPLTKHQVNRHSGPDNNPDNGRTTLYLDPASTARTNPPPLINRGGMSGSQATQRQIGDSTMNRSQKT